MSAEPVMAVPPSAEREAKEPAMKWCPVCEIATEADDMRRMPNEQPDVCFGCWDSAGRPAA